MEKMDLGDLIYGPTETCPPRRGAVLVASPLLSDVWFRHSAVMLLDGDLEKGYIGLALNIRTELTMADLIPSWEDGVKVPIYCGGPVDRERMFMLHRLGNLFDGSVEISDGLYVGGKLKQISEYIQECDPEDFNIRFFMGYSGWDPRQLEGEIKNQSWRVLADPDSRFLFVGDGDEYWRRMAAGLGEESRNWGLVPDSPDMN